MDLGPPISAIIPTHNRPELMHLAVASVLAQTYRGHIEVIVVFDATEPTDPDIVVPANRTLVTITNTRKRGLAGARNSGIISASHQLIAFLDDDDEWMPTKLAEQIALLRSHPSTAMIATAMVVFDGQRRIERLAPVELVTHEALLRDRMAAVHSSSFLFRRELLLGPIGLIDEDLPGSYGEDYDILLRTSKVGDIRVVNRPLVLVRWQGQSFFFGKWAQYATALEYLIEKHPEFASQRRAIGRIKSQIAFAQAASEQASSARKSALEALRNDPTRLRAYLAILISLRVISADTIARAAQRVGKGI